MGKQSDKVLQADSKCILIIDDDHAVRTSLAGFLQDSGFRTIEASGGREGIEKLKTENPDLIFLDLMIPEIDGFQLLEELNSAMVSIPVIVISGTGSLEDAVQAMRYGAWDFITKPIFDFQQLLEAINRSFQRYRRAMENSAYREWLEEQVAAGNREILVSNRNLALSNQRLKNLVNAIGNITGLEPENSYETHIFSEFAQLLKAEGGSLFRVLDTSLEQVTAMGNENVPESIHFPLEEGSPFRWVLEQSKPLHIEDIESAKHLRASGGNGYRDPSALVFPLINSQHETKFLVALHNKTHGPFTGRDMEVGSIFASYCGEHLSVDEAYQQLRENEKKYRELVENANSIILKYTVDGTITFINEYALRFFDYKEEDLLGKNIIGTVVPVKDPPEFDLPGIIDSFARGEATFIQNENTNINSTGEIVWIAWTNRPIFDEFGRVAGILSVGNDISNIKLTQKKLQQSLHEKDVLLKEIHHRVKNNMQIISSILNLQAGQSENEEVREISRVSQERIRSMSLVHEMLYHSSDLARINLADYLEPLISDLQDIYRTTSRVRIEKHLQTVMTDISKAVPFGLITNELITNSLKHAFPEGESGTIEVILRPVEENPEAGEQNMTAELILRDNGRGLPEKEITPFKEGLARKPDALSAGSGLGLTLVRELSDQIGAECTIKNADPAHRRGTCVYLRFPS